MVRFSLNIKTSVYTLFRKNKIKFGQKCFASPKVGTPVHLWTHKLRGVGVDEYAYYVNKFWWNLGLETRIWRQIV